MRIFRTRCFATEKIVDLASLAIFRTVARELSITRAAQQLGRVPSNVTTRIQQLEEELGVLLFERDRKRFSLTAQGELFLDYADRLLNLAEEAQQVLKPAAPTGVLRIGSMECTVASRLPLPLARFHQQWPDVRLEISTSPSRQLIDAVRKRRLDCALVALPPGDAEPDPEEIETWPVFREELVLLLPPGHVPVNGPVDLAPRSLAAFAPGCTYRGMAEDWLSADGSMPVGFRVQGVSSYHAMLACVSSGSCISVMPRSVLELMRHAAPVKEKPFATVDTALVWRRGFDTPAFAAWRETLAGSSDIVGEGL
jgi:DNA-binding transcriptional LysR family regulator